MTTDAITAFTVNYSTVSLPVYFMEKYKTCYLILAIRWSVLKDGVPLFCTAKRAWG